MVNRPILALLLLYLHQVAGSDALELGVARTDDVTERGNVWEQLEFQLHFKLHHVLQ